MVLGTTKKMVGIVGAGNMGSGIAQKYAAHDYVVCLVDLNATALENSRLSIESTLKQAVTRGIFSEKKAAGIAHNIQFSSSLPDLKEAPLVIEAIFENLAQKQGLMEKLEEIVSPTAILASNTSSFLLCDIAATMTHPERFLGLHYFYHPAKNRLVEIIRTNKTEQSYIDLACAMQEDINKIIVHAKDSPGFIVNRFFVPWLNEAVRIVHEGGASIATVEACAKAFFGIGMGPFELMNVTGLPITFHSCRSLAQSLGEFYAPCPLIEKQIEQNLPWDLSGEAKPRDFAATEQRLLAVATGVASAMVFNENLTTVADVELAARVGLAWPRGPFELLNEHGQAATLNTWQSLAKLHPSFTVSPILEDHTRHHKPFSLGHVLYEEHNGVAIITMNRPDAMNALDPHFTAELGQAFNRALDQAHIRGIVLQGSKRAFMAGADLGFFNRHLAAGTHDAIIDFARRAQELFLKIDESEKPVVALINGPALGGGLELALSTDVIIAASDATLGFPETGIGIYPGLGGTQRTVHKVGASLARYLVLTGTLQTGQDALALGLVDHLQPYPNQLAQALEIIAHWPQSARAANKSPAATVPDLLEAFAHPYPSIQNLTDESPRALEALKRISYKAPLALKLAEQLLQAAEKMPTRQGLALELEYLPQIFNSEDAKNGLRAAALKQRPQFTGR